jgi:hypothetical protein
MNSHGLVGVIVGALAFGSGCGDDAAGGADSGSGGTMSTTQGVSTTGDPSDPTNDSATSVADTTSAVSGASTSTGPVATSDGTSTSSTGGSGSTDAGIPPFDAMCEDPTGGSSGSGGSDTGGGMTTGGGLPDGASCSMDDECASDRCYVVGVLGGICGECTSDADCPGGGCSPPNPLLQTPAQCNLGEQGGGCETDDACCGIGICSTVISVPGILSASTCGQCESDADCGGPGLCQPNLDIMNLSGLWECVAPGSLPNGASCSTNATGDGACASGICATASVMGLLDVGICSECESNADCVAGTCTPPAVDLGAGLIPGMCV